MVKEYFPLICLVFSIAGCESGASIFDTNLRLSIELKSLPETLIYGYSDPIPEYAINEHAWNIYFDINNDSKVNKGDIYFSLATQRHQNTSLSTISIDELNAYVYAIEFESPVVGYKLGKIDYQIVNNSIIFEVDSKKLDKLYNITNNTNIYIHTTYIDQKTQTVYYDYFPSKDTYTTSENDLDIPDLLNDFEKNAEVVDGYDIPHIDIYHVKFIP